MSGHSKWATTKHKKAVVDARRGKMFARLIKNIEVAARVGGGDPGRSPTLYDAIQKAKKSSVPNDNIEKARKRGAGEEAGGADWQTSTYEGYAHNGGGVLIECLTDNRNRAASEVRVAMTRNGGTMADPGSVAYLFTRKGVVTLEKDGLTEDDLLAAVLDAGAEDVNDLGDSFEIISEPTDLVAVRTALQEAGIDYDSAEAGFQPSVTVPLDADGAQKVIRLVDALEDSDDVQDVYTNADISDEILAQIEEGGRSPRADSSMPVVNHHADHPGFAGVMGMVIGLSMLVMARRNARLAVDLASVSAADRVADIGCGPGNAVRAAAQQG